MFTDSRVTFNRSFPTVVLVVIGHLNRFRYLLACILERRQASNQDITKPITNEVAIAAAETGARSGLKIERGEPDGNCVVNAQTKTW